MPNMLVAFLAGISFTAAIPPPPPQNGRTSLPLHFGTVEMTCPVGGQRFKAVTTTMWSVTGRRPDDKPYSEISFPQPLPECPDNGLVLFADFTPAEIADLAKWVETPVYQSMRRTESQFYRAYWLAVKIHRPQTDALEQLLPAIWEAKERDGNNRGRPLTRRYQSVLINAVLKLSPEVSVEDQVWLKAQAANALREMGKFNEAERMRRSGEVELSRTTRPPLSDYLDKLKAVIARRDASDEPLDMIPQVHAVIICESGTRKDAFDRRYCGQEPIASVIKQDRLTAPSAADLDQLWQRDLAAARACGVALTHKQLPSGEGVIVRGFTFQFAPNTPKASQQCFYQRLYH